MFCFLLYEDIVELQRNGYGKHIDLRVIKCAIHPFVVGAGAHPSCHRASSRVYPAQECLSDTGIDTTDLDINVL